MPKEPLHNPFWMLVLAIRMGYEAKKRAIAGVLVSFLNKVARLMVRC
jgi:hypothetical protein